MPLPVFGSFVSKYLNGGCFSIVEQTLSKWVKAHRAGTLKAVVGKNAVTAKQMEISRLRAELARVTMERDILGKATAYCVLRM